MKSVTFNWTRAVILPLILALLESSWGSAWLALLALAAHYGPLLAQSGLPAGEPLMAGSETVRPLVGPVTAAVLVLAAWALTRVLLWYRTEMVLLRRIVVGTGALSWLLVAKVEQYPQFGLFDAAWVLDLLHRVPEAVLTPPFGAMAVAAYFWWRGQGLARGEANFDEVQGRFRLGLAASVVCLVALPLVAKGPVFAVAQGEIGPRVFLFLICGLLALALARLETIRREARAADPTVAAFHRHWLSTVFAAVLGLWGFTLLIAHLLDFDVGAVLATPLAMLGAAFDAVLLVVLWPLGLIVEMIVFVLRMLLYGRREGEWQGPPPSLKPEDLPERGLPFALSPEALLVLKWTAVLLLAAVVLYALWRAVGRPLWARRGDEVQESRDSVWSWGAFGTALLDEARRLRERLWRRRVSIFAPLEEGAPAVRSVREVYRRLMHLGAELEAPRPPEATPHEYQRQLEGVLAAEAELALITEAYVRARYSAHAPAESEVAATRIAWQRVHEAGAALLREKEGL